MQEIEFTNFGGSNKISNPPMQVYLSKVQLAYLKQYAIETTILKDSLDGFKIQVEIAAFNIIIDHQVLFKLAQIFKHHALVRHPQTDYFYFSYRIEDITDK